MTNYRRNRIIEYRKNKELYDDHLDNLFNSFFEKRKTHLFFNTYYLLPGELFWKNMDVR